MRPFVVLPPEDASSRHLYLWKPPGLPVFPPHEGAGPSVLAWWQGQAEFPAFAFPAGFEGGITHRLDTATSGLLLVARTVESLAELRGLFSGATLRKFYVFRSAVGPGAVLPAGGRTQGSILVEIPIGHHPKSRRRMIVADPPHRAVRGRWYPAWTRFTPLGAAAGAQHPIVPEAEQAWLWQAEIRTGVMHQIRVHAQYAGLPLLGDPLYGGADREGDAAAPPEFLLHHALMIFPDGVRTPIAPLPGGGSPPLAIGGRHGLV